MQVAICCIGRLENLYVREYVEHYKNIGVDKIFIYDNNYDGEDFFEDVIYDYIQSGFVDIINFRNKEWCQLEAYQDCSNKHCNEYDWMMFIDCGDEYLTMENCNNIKTFLSDPRYSEYDMIHINVIMYGDNGLVYYDTRKLQDRFTTPIMPLDKRIHFDIPENDHVSSIIRCKGKKLNWTTTPHAPYNPELKCCNALGIPCNPIWATNRFTMERAYFKHYTTKTIDEYINIKCRRGYPDYNKDSLKQDFIYEFFRFNDISKEKMRYIENYYKSQI